MSNRGMFRVVTRTTIVQQPTEDFPNRRRTLIFNFITDFEASDGWSEQTNTARVTLPKNVYTRDGNGKLVSLAGTTVNMGGWSANEPLYLRGDRLTLEVGYRYFDNQNNEKIRMATVFTGFITRVYSRMPVVLECMDNMYLLQQTPAVNKTYPATTSLEAILKDMLQGTGFTVNVTTDTNMGEFMVENETVSEVLARLRKDYHFYPYFRGNELRIGSAVYLEQDAVDSGTKTFKFQQNIIDDDLNYNRTDDEELSAIAYSINKVEVAGTVNKRGKAKTKHKRLEALVTIRRGKVISYVKPEGSAAHYTPNTVGERRTLHFWNVQTTDRLIELATAELKKYYYTGLKGKFITFGMPYVRMGDNVNIIDPVLPERNGRYKVKSVRYFGGVAGLRQEIELDYLITRIDAQGNGIS